MAITKTDFINYTRCRRYAALEEIKKEKLSASLTIEEYRKQENDEIIREILGNMFSEEDGEEVDLTIKHDKQLEAMMDYYKEVEFLAAKQVKKVFGGDTIFSEDTFRQESFDFQKNGIKYLCYVDIYNEVNDEINIIEVKATTSKKFVDDLFYGERGKDKYPLFVLKDGIYRINRDDINDKNEKNFNEKILKLKNRFSSAGKYVFDLAVQRYIIENDFLTRNINKKINYYLAVLNSKYVYDGYKENGKRVYNTDENGNDIISIFDLNELTKEMIPLIDDNRKMLEKYIYESDNSKCRVSEACELKKNTECKYKCICFKDVPKYNTSYNYLNFRSFKDLNNVSYNKYDLINEGYLKFDDIPKEWLNNPNHIIQRDVYDTNKEYVDKEKIKASLSSIEYPIYHLDFETFPCPIPRFKGEKPYTQSCFEFSLHIEHEEGVCDKEKDNFIFLAETLDDEREELVKALINHIDGSKGTMLAQNVGFEKSRIKELANVFPQYKEKLMKIHDIGFDLLYVIRNNEKLFLDLGFDNEKAKKINYYHKDQSGSYSIKKTLPLFTNLKYTDLEIQNGTDALVEYSRYNLMNDTERKYVQENLRKYCCQDTWAMVEILKGLRKLVK
ncbi:MAG: DUF2779 domain-containing protein [Bacilli bacterium]|nr:DUF2779 domain-containing protein [Bacilli bacterium]